ncbi:MAG: peroxidase, partial [Henriciella sp.]|nr:peroxidase [Henriciella sp.]
MDHDLDLTDGAEESADILVPEGDAFFDPNSTGAQVITFNRALFDAATGTDASNPREQENEITSWIDGSMIYGSSVERNAALREAGTPFLKTSAGNLLPFNEGSLTNANGFITDPTALFLAGDIRANEQLGLTVMHTLFVREHNRIAQNLLDDDPDADSEAVYEQARRLVIAKIQVITYQEWLPVLLGPDAIPAYSGYDDDINPTIFNEFSVAAFRLGHSMLNEQLLRLDATGAEIAGGQLDLTSSFITGPTSLVSEEDLDPILRGFATQLHQEIDPLVVDDIRNFLFGQPGSGGFDLASLNIQRGRDHGVPGYNDMREAMGLTRVTQFGQITSDND